MLGFIVDSFGKLVVPDLVPRGEIVCRRQASKWQEPYQSESDVLRVTAIAADLTQAIAVAKDNFVWEDYDE